MAKKVASSRRDEMTPEAVLRAFFAAMCKWERHAFKEAEKTEEPDDAALLEGRNKIVTEYCTAKRRVYSEPLSYGDPPEYDPRTEDVIEVVEESPSRVVIFTKQREGFKNKRRFVLMRKSGRWLLDSWQWQDGTKWQRGII
jgi:NTF2 fold immunity protein